MPKLVEFQNKFVVRPSRVPFGGLGLFAREDIPRGTRMGWYRGNLITRKQWKNCIDDSYMWMILDDYDREFYIDGKQQKKNNKLRYVNGCKTPGQFALVNVIAYQKYDKIWYKTSKKVKKGEELIVNYGGDYWKPVEV